MSNRRPFRCARCLRRFWLAVTVGDSAAAKTRLNQLVNAAAHIDLSSLDGGADRPLSSAPRVQQ